MTTFYKGCAKTMLICGMLFLSFLAATAILDTFARYNGYYNEGIQDSEALRNW